MRRESGYYWVKHPFSREWTVAHWIESMGYWTGDFEAKATDDYWLIIDERKLVHRE